MTAAKTKTRKRTAAKKPAAEKPAPKKTWPSKGYAGDQPWQTEDPHAMAPITHSKGLITSGSGGPDVIDLAELLAKLGYESSISRGESPYGGYGESEQAAVEAFCRDYGVEEDPAVISATHAGAVGPWIWQALYNAAESS